MIEQAPKEKWKWSSGRNAGIAFMIAVPCILAISMAFPFTSPVIRSTDRGSLRFREVMNLFRAVTDGSVIGPDGVRLKQTVICYSLGEDGVFDAKDARSW